MGEYRMKAPEKPPELGDDEEYREVYSELWKAWLPKRVKKSSTKDEDAGYKVR